MRRPMTTLLVFAACLHGAAAFAATPPKQPEKGPGGAEYTSAAIVKKSVGTASASTFVFHAADTPAKPRSVVVLFHSWGAANPQLYGGWIEHLAKRGHLVLFPRFQDINKTRPVEASERASRLIQDAIAALAEDAQARPDPDRVAYVGHLAGSAIALNLAAAAGQDEAGLKPKLIYALMPGGIASDPKARGIPLEDLSAIDKGTLLIAMSGDRDYLPSDRTARRILREATDIPATRKLFMRAGSDDHGFPALTASLSSPGSPNVNYDAAAIKIAPDAPRDPKEKGPVWRWSADMSLTGEQTILAAQLGTNVVDTLDYLAFWKTLDLALDAAFVGKDAVALRSDPRFIDMGTWSDGWPVRRLSAEMPKSGNEEKEVRPRRRL